MPDIRVIHSDPLVQNTLGGPVHSVLWANIYDTFVKQIFSETLCGRSTIEGLFTKELAQKYKGKIDISVFCNFCFILFDSKG